MATADVDNDGIEEIVFGNEDGNIHIIQYHDGDYIDEWRSPNLDWEIYGLAMGDTDSDGTVEIVAGNQYGMLYIYGYQGPGLGYAREWEFQLNKEEPFGLAVGNLDDDEYEEIVIGSLQLVSTEENVFVFGYDGSTYTEEYRYLMTDFLNYAHSVVIHDVDCSRAIALAERLRLRFGANRIAAVTDLSSAMAAADGLIQATPVGMLGHPGLPLPIELLRPAHWVADIIYFPLETELLKLARLLGCRTMDGSGMVVFQAAEAFRLFTGVAPDYERMLRCFASLN